MPLCYVHETEEGDTPITYIYTFAEINATRLRAGLSPDGRKDPTHTHTYNVDIPMEPLLEAHGHPTKQRQPPEFAEKQRREKERTL